MTDAAVPERVSPEANGLITLLIQARTGKAMAQASARLTTFVASLETRLREATTQAEKADERAANLQAGFAKLTQEYDATLASLRSRNEALPEHRTMSAPQNCRHEPPYPGESTVLFSLAAPSMTAHRASARCAKEYPHEVSECGEWSEGGSTGEPNGAGIEEVEA